MSLNLRHAKSRVTGRVSAIRIHMFVVMMVRDVARRRSGGHGMNPGPGMAAVTRVDMPVLGVANRKRWCGKTSGYEIEGDEKEMRV